MTDASTAAASNGGTALPIWWKARVWFPRHEKSGGKLDATGVLLDELRWSQLNYLYGKYRGSELGYSLLAGKAKAQVGERRGVRAPAFRSERSRPRRRRPGCCRTGRGCACAQFHSSGPVGPCVLAAVKSPVPRVNILRLPRRDRALIQADRSRSTGAHRRQADAVPGSSHRRPRARAATPAGRSRSR